MAKSKTNAPKGKYDNILIVFVCIALPIAGFVFYKNMFAPNTTPQPNKVTQPAVKPIQPGQGQPSGVNKPNTTQNVTASSKMDLPDLVSQFANSQGEASYIPTIMTGRHDPFVRPEDEESSLNRKEFMNRVKEKQENKQVVRSPNLEPWEFEVSAVGGSGSSFYAIIDTGDGNVSIVGEGDIVRGYTVKKVSLEGVTLVRNGRNYFLKVGRGKNEDNP